MDVGVGMFGGVRRSVRREGCSWDMLYERRIKKDYEDDGIEEKDKKILST